MAYNPPSLVDTQAGKAITTTWGAQVIETLEFLNGAVGGNLANDIFNGGFEFDSAADGVPDFWSKSDNHGTTYPGGTVAIETTSPLAGASSIKMVHPGGVGNGGGLLESDYYDVGGGDPFKLTWLHYATAAGMKNEVIIYWYDKDQVALGGGDASTTIYSSTENPTAGTQFSGICNPPSTAKYFTIGLVGGFTDTDVAGTAYFDNVYKERIKTRVYNVSSGTTVNLLDIRDCKKLSITIAGLTWSAATSLNLQVSTDNGATWNTSAIYGGGVPLDSSTVNPSATSANITPNNSSLPVHGDINIYNLGAALNKHFRTDMMVELSGGATYTFINEVGVIELSSVCNALKLFIASGAFTSGTITVEEIF